MRTKVLTIQIFILFLTSIFLMAQDDKTLKEKLSKVDEASKIVITTEKGEITFEGDEAKQLLKRMKSKKMHKKLEWISEDGEDIEFDGDNVMIFKSKDGEKHIIKKIKKGDQTMIMKHGDIDDIDLIENGKTIKVEVEDGEKTVTVTTKEDGEEKVETFKGKEADEYLENMEDDHNVIIDIDIDDLDGDNVWIHKVGDNDKEIDKKVEVRIEDGVKKVTVTTTKDGEKKVEVFEGDEADEYFENSEKNENVHIIKKKFKGDKKHKVIIKEIKEEEKK